MSINSPVNSCKHLLKLSVLFLSAVDKFSFNSQKFRNRLDIYISSYLFGSLNAAVHSVFAKSYKNKRWKLTWRALAYVEIKNSCSFSISINRVFIEVCFIRLRPHVSVFETLRFRNAPSSLKTHQKLCVHTIVFIAFSPSTRIRLKTLQQSSAHARNRHKYRSSCDVNVMMSACSKPFVFAIHTNTIGLRFQISPLWTPFSMKMLRAFNCCHVDDRRKCIEKYAFSNKNGCVDGIREENKQTQSYWIFL